MNIKGLLGANIGTQVRPAEKVERASIQSDIAHDRDANGQQTFDDQKKEEHGPMSDEQLEKAMEHLRQLPAVKEHKWTVQLSVEENLKRYVLVKDNLGNLIRRIPEADLWTLNHEDSSGKGRLLKKSA